MTDDIDKGGDIVDRTPFDETKGTFQGFVGYNISKLTAVSVMQLRAMGDLSMAIRADENLSESTRDQADKALAKLMSAVDQIEKIMSSITEYYQLGEENDR